MAAVTNTSGILTLTASFTEVITSGFVSSASIQQIISVADQLSNGTGAAKTCDLMYAKSLTLSAAITTLDFSALPDPGGTNRDWTSGRVRFGIVQVTDATSGHDVKIYGAASNGVAWLPLAANPAYARANSGVWVVYDPNSNGAGVGNVLSSTSKLLDLDPGANTVTGVNVIFVGDSVA